MQLELSRREVELLRKALDTYCREYDRMLFRADNPDVQHAMRAESDALAAMRRRVDALAETPSSETYV